MLDTIFNTVVKWLTILAHLIFGRPAKLLGTGANSTSSAMLDRTPSATVPWAQTFHISIPEKRNPTVSGQSFLQHIGNEQ